MNKEYTKLLCDILSNMAHIDHIRPSDIPDIDLYMDQVTGFMDSHLHRRYEDDKVLTKTMINNYAKNKLLPPPTKKRYSKEQMIVLIFIYYLKDFLPLSDIQAILQPITERFFHAEDGFDIEDIYAEIYELGKSHILEVSHDIMDCFHTAANSFADYEGAEKESLQMFSFICLLSIDIYLKKEVIESLIDALPDRPRSGKK